MNKPDLDQIIANFLESIDETEETLKYIAETLCQTVEIKQQMLTNILDHMNTPQIMTFDINDILKHKGNGFYG